MSLPYVAPQNFQEVPLQDSLGRPLGSLWLCKDTRLEPKEISFPPQKGGVAFPSGVASPHTFPQVYQKLAAEIGRYLSRMNWAMLRMHQALLTLYLNHDRDPVAHFKADGQRNGLSEYITAAGQLADALFLKGGPRKWWPLVPHNTGRLHNRSGWNAGPGNQDGQFVSNHDLFNAEFPYSNGEVIGFSYRIPRGNLARGTLSFYHDAQWSDPNPRDDTYWSSFSFITNFELTLVEPSRGRDDHGRVPSSSSSSIYYQASSSMPGRGPFGRGPWFEGWDEPPWFPDGSRPLE